MHERDTGLRREAFRRELLDKAGVKVALEAPRTEVPVPANAPAMGPENAPITIVAFTDYQCPFCHRAQNTMDQILTQYAARSGSSIAIPAGGPCPWPFRRPAPPGARASRGMFWEYYKSLNVRLGRHGGSDLLGRAEGLKLDSAAFKTLAPPIDTTPRSGRSRYRRPARGHGHAGLLHQRPDADGGPQPIEHSSRSSTRAPRGAASPPSHIFLDFRRSQSLNSTVRRTSAGVQGASCKLNSAPGRSRTRPSSTT
jgi:hypothetical protein